MFQKFVHRALPQDMPGKQTKSRRPERIQDANAEITGDGAPAACELGDPAPLERHHRPLAVRLIVHRNRICYLTSKLITYGKL